MTAATFEALAKTLNALVREGWGESVPEEKAEVPPHMPTVDLGGATSLFQTSSAEQVLEQLRERALEQKLQRERQQAPPRRTVE
jgi:hypothetical protein